MTTAASASVAAVPPRTRLLVAAALCAASLGLGWAATPGSEGYVTAGTITPGFCTTSYDGYLDCAPGTYTAGFYIPGSPDGAARGFEADARVVLVPAAVALAWAARRRTPASRRAVAIAAVALAVVAGRAGTEGQLTAAAVGLVAAALAASVVWGGRAAGPSTTAPQRRVARPGPAPGVAGGF